MSARHDARDAEVNETGFAVMWGRFFVLKDIVVYGDFVGKEKIGCCG